ncbi:fucolectin [Amia ocellicauda]|uniref:fucolectin n=1 Tax=Amia ocellicauda TaxID=2972642 RepID=UPI0034641C05
MVFLNMLVLLLGLGVAHGCCPGAKNVALQGKATQSSILQGPVGFMGIAMNAIDGNHESNYHKGSCTHTTQDLAPWWRVDLLKPHKVAKVIITNRGDCCPERLAGAEIRIGNSLENYGNNNPRCATISSATIGEVFNCGDMEGRYVNVVIPDRNEYLTLCEVEVIGVPACDDNCLTVL